MTEQGPPPTGTVYGRGGVDARPPHRARLHPAVLALVVAAGAIVVAAGGYWLLRDPAEPPRTAASVTAPATPALSPSAEPEPEPFGTGSWLLSPAGDPGSYLGPDDDVAAIAGRPAPLTVVAGLADESCFTIRDGQGRYLRHYDYRLRFDRPGDGDLFRNDATFCAEDGGSAGTVRLRSKNYPGHVVHRRGGELYIDEPDGSDEFTRDSTFAVRPN